MKQVLFKALIFALSFVLSLQDTCLIEFNDSFCSECTTGSDICNGCSTQDGYAFEDTKSVCHKFTSSSTFQSTGQPVIHNNAYYKSDTQNVQMLDPFCVLGSKLQPPNTDPSVLCGKCAGFKDSLKAERYVSEDTKECHTTCDYDAVGRFNNGNKCAPCNAACATCTSDTTCNECAYSYQRFTSDTAFLPKWKAKNIDPSTDCQGTRSDSIDLTYFVIPSGNAGDSAVTDNFNNVFIDIFKKIGNYKKANVKILLLKVDGGGAGNDVFYIMDADVNSYLLRVFERTLSNVIIRPLFCNSQDFDDTTNDHNFDKNCYDSGERPTFKWKSYTTHFFVNYRFEITDVIIDGYDLLLGLLPWEAYLRGIQISYCPGLAGSCGVTGFAYERWSNATNFETFRLDRKYGVFVFEYIKDFPDAVVPELIIRNCDIQNFYHSQYYTSFVQFDIYGGKLTMSNCNFNRFFFPHGLISNSFLPVDRNDPMTSSYTQISCKRFNPSVTNCYSISITNSNFKNYNPVDVKILTTYYKNIVEGAVLTLHNFDGPIIIDGCTFENFQAFSPLGTIGKVLPICGKFEFTGASDFTALLQGSHNIITTSKYKLFLDKHFRKYLQAPDTDKNLPTTAVIHLRNVTKGLVVTNSVFKKVYSVAGGSIYINGFNNTLTYPIVIAKNTFTNNFAQLFALNVLIYKQKQDFPNLACNGIYIDTNIFNNNFGCFNTLGNVIVACEPSVTSSSLGFDNKKYDDYYTGYSSAVNHDYTSDSFAKKNFTRHFEEFSSFKDTPQTWSSPLDNQITFDTKTITISNNRVERNFAILSNGFYVQGAMKLSVTGNTFSQNSIPLPSYYSGVNFTTVNAFYLVSAVGVPESEPTGANTMKESCPLIIRHSNYITIEDNTFDGNTQGFWGGDYHIAQAITILSTIGREPVLIQRCNFLNHQGFPVTITGRGIYQYVNTAFITFNYWETLDAPWKGIAATYFTVKDCTFTNNKFAVTAAPDVKKIYFKDDQTLGGSYENPFAYFLKYVLQGEVTAIDITNKINQYVTSTTTSPMDTNLYFVNLNVKVTGAQASNNIFYNATCPFNNFFFPYFTVSDSTFTDNTLLDSLTTQNALLCALDSTLYNAWSIDPQVYFARNNFYGTIGQDILANQFCLQASPDYFVSFFKLVIEDITSSGTQAKNIAPILISSSKYISASRLNISNFVSTYGFVYVLSSESIEFNAVKAFDSYSSTTGLVHALNSQNATFKIEGYNNTLNTAPFPVEDGDDGVENPKKTRAMVIAEQSSISVNDSSFYDGSAGALFIIYSSATLNLNNIKIQNYKINKTVVWASLSSKLNMDHCIMNDMQIDNGALAGIVALDTSEMTMRASQFRRITGRSDLILSANLSDAIIEGSVFEDNRGSSDHGLITAKLGTLYMRDSQFINNKGGGETLIYALLMSAFEVTGCKFDNNSAAQTHKLIDLKKLMNPAVFTNTDFIDRIDMTNFNPDNIDDIYSLVFTSNFINAFDTDINIDSCSFIGGGSTSGSVSIVAEAYNAKISNSKFHNNIGYPTGSIGGRASLAVENTVFYGNTETICLFAGTNATFKNVTFQEEKSLSLFFENLESVELDQVVFDGLSKSDLQVPGWNYASRISPKPRGIQIHSSKNIQITRTSWKNLYKINGQTYSAGIYVYNAQVAVPLKSTLSISNSDFFNVSADNGGAICIRDIGKNTMAVKIDSTVIEKAYAAINGGAIYYHSFEDTSQVDYLNISGTSFIRNSEAAGAGGAIYYESRRPNILSQNIFENNKAYYGANWASYPVRISNVENPDPKLWENLSSGTVVNSRILELAAEYNYREVEFYETGRILQSQQIGLTFSSGVVSYPPPILALYDLDDQVVSNWQQGTIKVSFNDPTVVKETPTTFNVENGIFVLYPLVVLFTPGTTVSTTLTSTIVLSSGDQTKSIPLSWVTTALFRECKRGERETDSRECVACPENQYILARDSVGVCKNCPEFSRCFGADKIGPEPGYWRFDGWKARAISCLNPAACLGYSNSSNYTNEVTCKERLDETFCYTGLCDKGYEGNVCSSCSPGYALSSGIYCVPCTDNPLFYVVLVIVIIVAIFFIVFTVKNALKVKDASKLSKPKSSVLIKIFLNYVQLVSIVGSFQFQWPEAIKTMFQAQDKVASGPSEAFSIDCLLPPQSDSMRTFFLKLLFIAVSPLIIIFIGTIVWAIIFKLKKEKFDKRQFKSNLTTTFVVVLFMLHATLVQNSIMAFRCKNIGDETEGNEEYYLERDLTVECWGNLHVLWVLACALPAFLIWGIGTPVFAFFLLRRNLRKLDLIEFKSKYGFLYDGYKKRKFYWEFVILYRKIAMIFISVFMVTLGVKIQALCVLGVCFMSYLFQIYGQPFEDNQLNLMERRALVNATITLYCGIYYVTGELPEVAGYVLLALILALNVYFFIVWFKSLIQEFIKERKAAQAQLAAQKAAAKKESEKPGDNDEAQKLAEDADKDPNGKEAKKPEKKGFMKYLSKKKT